MIDHLGIAVTDVSRSAAFYEKALAPLGYSITRRFGEHIALGQQGKPTFWLSQGKPHPMHIGFVATGRATVRAFHQAALAAGGKDNGAPGVREHYHPNYYGAFVLDPDGYNIEAVCHEAFLG